MGPISLSIQVDAPRERALDLICDLSRRPAWTDHFIEEYRLERLNPAGEGAGARFRVGAPGGVEWMETVIAEVEPPSKVVEHGSGGRFNRIQIRTVWELSEGPGAVNTLTLTFWTQPQTLWDRLREAGRAGWWRRRWSRALRRFRALAEAPDAEIEAVRVAAGAHLPA